MTSTSIATTDLTTDIRADELDGAPTVLLDPAAGDRHDRHSRRIAVVVLVGVLVVMGVTAGVAYRVHQGDPAPVTSDLVATTTSDAAESGHGTRAGVATGAGLSLTRTGRFVAAPGSDATLMAHGTAGSVVIGR